MSAPGHIPKPSSWRGPTAADAFVGPFNRFAKIQAAGGLVLIGLAVGAMVWANSGSWEGYHHLFHETNITVGFGAMSLSMPLEAWINDLLMAVFFLLVGLEIKREVLVGELSSPKKAALPLAAALGGMVVPAGIFAAANWGEPTIHGWGVPMATDIAFAIGVLALLGNRVPMSVRVFLTSLAIADDLGALLVIAVFYTDDLEMQWLYYGAGVIGVLCCLNYLGFRSLLWYLLPGMVLWVCIFNSGIHATIAGVLLAMTIPARRKVDRTEYVEFARRMIDQFEAEGDDGDETKTLTTPTQQAAVLALEDAGRMVRLPARRMETMLVPWVAFLILPVFALANAGVHIPSGGVGIATNHITLGVALGLMIGKPVGIGLATLLAWKIGLGELPTGMTWRHVHGTAWLAGIGFTMALFIANLAFPDPSDLDLAKIGVLGGSMVAGVIGLVVLATGPSAKNGDG